MWRIDNVSDRARQPEPGLSDVLDAVDPSVSHGG
jgi:hypothetical protein